MKKFISLTITIIIVTTFLIGCTPKKEATKEVDLKEVQAAIKEALGDDYETQEMNMEMLKDITGINESDIETIVSEVPLMNVSIDTFIAIKAVEGKGEVIETALEKYRTYYQEDAF